MKELTQGRIVDMDFDGIWRVVSSPDFDDEYLRLGGAPYVTFRQNDDFVKGEYEIEVMCGTINGGAHSDFVDFHFPGSDEMEEAFGEGQATLLFVSEIVDRWRKIRQLAEGVVVTQSRRAAS